MTGKYSRFYLNLIGFLVRLAVSKLPSCFNSSNQLIMANKIKKHFELIGKIDDISIGNY